MAIAEEEEGGASALARHGEGDQFDQLSQLGHGKKRGAGGDHPGGEDAPALGGSATVAEGALPVSGGQKRPSPTREKRRFVPWFAVRRPKTHHHLPHVSASTSWHLRSQLKLSPNNLAGYVSPAPWFATNVIVISCQLPAHARYMLAWIDVADV
jgi:hypothetical protein